MLCTNQMVPQIRRLHALISFDLVIDVFRLETLLKGISTFSKQVGDHYAVSHALTSQTGQNNINFK